MAEEKKPRVFDPNDFRIEEAKVENAEEYLALLDEFFSTREQLTVGLHVPRHEMTEFLRHRMKHWLASGTSTCATYIPTNQVVGVSITTNLDRDNPLTFITDKDFKPSEEIKNLLHVVDLMEKKANLFSDPKINKIVEIVATTVNPEFSGNRITYRLTEEIERLALEKGCQLATAQSSNKITQHIRQKMGYKEHLRVDYETLKINGKRVMDMSVLNGSTVVLMLVKNLQE